ARQAAGGQLEVAFGHLPARLVGGLLHAAADGTGGIGHRLRAVAAAIVAGGQRKRHQQRRYGNPGLHGSHPLRKRAYLPRGRLMAPRTSRCRTSPLPLRSTVSAPPTPSALTSPEPWRDTRTLPPMSRSSR